jgi:hypothetical protein
LRPREEEEPLPRDELEGERVSFRLAFGIAPVPLPAAEEDEEEDFFASADDAEEVFFGPVEVLGLGPTRPIPF